MNEKEKPNHLTIFQPAIQNWFSEKFASPTPPQIQGWPPIFRSENTLILAPTGSGKTLAAFLVCINEIFNKLVNGEKFQGIFTLYISPLKALNYDIERNLEQPLEGIKQSAKLLKLKAPEIRVAVRTGDTPQKERLHMTKRPPHILITTPESLHLLLTSRQPRQILKAIKYVIIDEIHALSENKRGTFLSVLLERLQAINDEPFVRIGLSATQKPLTEIAKFLGGFKFDQKAGDYSPRPVTIVDAGMRKKLDIKILSPVQDFTNLPENSVWPDIYQKLLEQIQQHRSTLIFANNRAAVERITAEINERAGFELAKAHHGSVSKEKRRLIEDQLKRGELSALVATATLELGIDMGAIDLVCQVESPKSVARALQRVGRAGHLYRAASKGRLLPKMRSDLLEMAVIAGAMISGDVAPINIPKNCLDILAQQIVAIVALNPIKVDSVFEIIRRAYPYRNLPQSQFLSVLEMISGRYPSETFRDLKPRISWDRVNNVLHPLPGTQRTAIFGGGAIPDTGQYGCYLEDGSTKIGELEEEFIYERRIGEVFVLGTSNWRIKEITHDRVVVSPAPGEPARMPFWKGEFSNRSAHLGKLVGSFLREFADKLNAPDCLDWLQQNYHLEKGAAENLIQYLIDQKTKAGFIPDDRKILCESFADEMGDLRFVLLSPYGGAVHLPWKLALLAQFRKQLGIEPESYHSDAGLTFRYPMENEETFFNIIKTVNSCNVEDLVIEELANSFFFGLRFRQNAGRAMLMPLYLPGKRAPLWLQRMRARDLLEVARQHPSFPIVMETYRESLLDFLAMDELKKLLQEIESQQVQLIFRQTASPSPFTSSLLFEFMSGYMYEYEKPKSITHSGEIVERDLLDELLLSENSKNLLDESAIVELEQRLQALKEGSQARTPAELYELLRRLGDLTTEEISRRVEGDWKQILQELIEQKSIVKIFIPKTNEIWRWISVEDFPVYRAALCGQVDKKNIAAWEIKISLQIESNEIVPAETFVPQNLLIQNPEPVAARKKLLEQFSRHHAAITLTHILQRYPFEKTIAEKFLSNLKQEGSLLKLPRFSEAEQDRWAFRETIERIRRKTIQQQRARIKPCDTSQFVDFLLNWQHRTISTQLHGVDGLVFVLEQMQGLSLPATVWENEIFAPRIKDYRPEWLDQLCQSGDLVWFGNSPGSSSGLNIRFAFRENLPLFYVKPESANIDSPENPQLEQIRVALQKLGACFITDLSIESGLSPSQCTKNLWSLIQSGEVSNDSFSVIRAGKRGCASYDKTEAQALKFRFSSGSRLGQHRRFRAQRATNRWFLLPAANSEKFEDGNFVESVVRQLLLRYGLICREIYQLESMTIPWRNAYETLIRLEWRGEIRRGYFVKGLSGIQFALPQAAAELLSEQQKIKNQFPELLLLNSCDSANLYGAASPLPLLHSFFHDWRLLRHPNNFLILKSGQPVLAIENFGRRLTPLRDLNSAEKRAALSLLPQLLNRLGGKSIRSLKVEFWNNQPIRYSEITAILKELGFRDEFKIMILEKKF